MTRVLRWLLFPILLVVGIAAVAVDMTIDLWKEFKR